MSPFSVAVRHTTDDPNTVDVTHQNQTPICKEPGHDIGNEALQALLDAGAQKHEDVNVGGGGKLIATVKDADGNIIGLLQAPVGGWT